MRPRRVKSARGSKRAPGAKGKRFLLAPTGQVEAAADVAAEFMKCVFDLEPGDYLITDESDLWDFVPFDESGTAEIWSRIDSVYNIGFEDVGSGRLVRLFEVIAKERRLQ
jgi:hypothetical protein